MYTEILERIEKYDSIVIFGHTNPDGDCFGSQMALRCALKLHYPHKKIYAVGSGVHRFFKMLGKMDVVSEKVIEQSLAILVDGNDIPRMEDQRVKLAKAFVKFDHHVDVGSFTEGPFIVKESATSCCEIILDFLRESNFEINQTIAQALLLGIVTDSARFQFVSDYPKLFKDVAFLSEKGASLSTLNYELNQTNEDAAIFKGYVYNHYQKTRHGLIYLRISKQKLEKYRLSSNSASGFVNLLSNIRGYPIWAFFCENRDGSIHVELRSSGPMVQPIALEYGGGGHPYAAGTTIVNPTEEIITKMINDLDLLAKTWKEEQK